MRLEVCRMSALRGRKTYLLAAGAVLAAVAGYLTGELTAVQALETGWTGAVAATLRAGIGAAK